MSKVIKEGSVIQVNEHVNDWCGCLMIVEEVKDWGVLASQRVAKQGTTCLRLRYGQFEHIGEAVLVPAK